MQALELRDDSLQWETERQNRIHQTAIEKKKKQVQQERVRGDAPYTEAAMGVAFFQMEEWLEKVNRIPDMRSALIPLEDGQEEQVWSKPFSLVKADMEPWLSFYKGYRQSRLFLESPRSREASADDPGAMLDYPVRALLELKQVGTTLISAPPVQINGQVEYFDLEGDLRANSEPMRMRALLKSAADIHESQVRRAVDKGREMGNRLHDALMGEGYANLIHAWTKVHNRKPTIDELHMMLTTGRVKMSSERRSPAFESRAVSSMPVADTFPSRAVAEKPREPRIPKEQPQRVEAPVQTPVEEAESAIAFGREPEQAGNRRKIILHLVQALVCCVALAGVAFVF